MPSVGKVWRVATDGECIPGLAARTGGAQDDGNSEARAGGGVGESRWPSFADAFVAAVATTASALLVSECCWCAMGGCVENCAADRGCLDGVGGVDPSGREVAVLPEPACSMSATDALATPSCWSVDLPSAGHGE